MARLGIALKALRLSRAHHPALWRGSLDESVPGTEQVNQGAAQSNHEGVSLDPRAIDRGIPNH
jgi:hypothetical protein